MKTCHYLFYVTVVVTSLIINGSWAIPPQGMPPEAVVHHCTSARQDEAIELQISTLYSLNPVLNGYNIKVKSVNGVVFLYGSVRTPIEKDLAYDLASFVDRVKKIDNNLEIKPHIKLNPKQSRWGQKVTDATITSLVKSKLLLEPITHGLNIHVVTVNNITTLSGKVNSNLEKERARDLAINTKGVAGVENKLKVITR